VGVALEARGVGYRVGGQTLLDGVSLELQAGELTVLVGPNGAGKSTLLRLLAGELEPSAGAVLVAGQPVGRLRCTELARRRALLPQRTILEFAFPAREVVALGRYPHRRSGSVAADEAAVERALERTAMLSRADRSYPTLSGGEQARVDLARVLAQETPILLLDEPTASLDLHHQQLVLSTLRESTAAGACALAVLHDLNLAAAHADRIAVLAAGRIAACGPPWEALAGETLSRVFEHPLAVVCHPRAQRPLVVSLA
jgi:iron complex transport system ATP-binding protein